MFDYLIFQSQGFQTMTRGPEPAHEDILSIMKK